MRKKDKPVSPPAVAHMITVRIYLCVQGEGPSIHKENFEFNQLNCDKLISTKYLDIDQIG